MVKPEEQLKISSDRIVRTPVIVLPEGHPDADKFNPNQVIIVPRSGQDTYLKVSPYSKVSSSSPEVFVLDSNTKDTPDLSDIENIEYIKYFDPVSKIEKLKVIIKIRNSSKRKKDVAGVDARIYQPRGA